MAGEVTDPRVKAVIAGGAATATGATLAAGKLASKKKKPTKRKPTKAVTRHAANAKDTKVKTAQMKIDELKKIKPSNLSPKDVKARNALIQQQKEIMKGLTKTSAKELAKKYGLASIPGVGVFLATVSAALSSTPAGQGSALYGPGSKKNK
jgi:hypothetical protein